jgi:1-phosphofructokinase
VIITLTPNPSVDRTMEVEVVERGQVIRARSARIDAGGKGVNVSRALVRNGFATRAVLPSGGAEGAQLEALLGFERVDVVPVPIAGAIRANITLVEPDGTVTKLNEPGPTLSTEEEEALALAAVRSARAGDWVVLSGSLPPGVGADFYARLVARLGAAGARVAVDTSDAALELSLSAAPQVIKPNRSELSAVTGRKLLCVGDVVEAAGLVREKGARVVLVSLGADGALLVDDDGAVAAEAYLETPRSAVGAGDALLAGFLAAGAGGSSALVEAVAWGAAAASLPGSSMPRPGDLDRAAVHLHTKLDVDRPLGDEGA